MALVVDYTPSGGPIAAAVSPGFTALSTAGLNDVNGNTWSLDAGSLLNQVASTGSPWSTRQLLDTRGPSATVSSSVIFNFVAGGTQAIYLMSRAASTGATGYLGGVDAAQTNALKFYQVQGGGVTQSGITGPTTTLTAGTTYRIQFDTAQTNATTTTLTMTLMTLANAVLQTFSVTDTLVALQNVSAANGVCVYGGDATHGCAHLQTYNAVAPAGGSVAAAATAYTLSGPASGPIGTAQTFTVGANGTLAASNTVTIAVSPVSGTITPTSVVISSATPTATFTYNPAVAQAETLTASGTLTSATASFTGTGGTTLTILVNNATLATCFSDGNWDAVPAATLTGVAPVCVQSTNVGAWLRFTFTGTQAVINIDSTPYGTTTNPPVVRKVIDNGLASDAQLLPSQATIPTTGLAAGSHTLEMEIIGADEFSGTREATAPASPSNVVRVFSVTLDGGSTLTAPVLLPSWYWQFGDSITESVRVNRTSAEPLDHDSWKSSVHFIAAGLGSNKIAIGYGASGYENGGSGSALNAIACITKYSTGRNRSFRTAPTDVVTLHGTNGTTTAADVQNWLSTARTFFGASTWLHVVTPPGGFAKAILDTGVANYKSATPSDAKVTRIDVSASVPILGLTGGGTQSKQASDGLHPDVIVNAQFSAAVVLAINSAKSVTSSAGLRFARRI